ncbi:MAG: hypothetical protein FJ313_06540 [Gemmatimonadetes bacterium]|nr:hypothetical protein [Gemmatimonadota bacterium]
MRDRASLVLLASLLVSTAGAARPAAAETIPKDTEFRVKLLAPLSTETNRKGDKITAQVVTPEPFTGDMLEGEVKESKSGGKITGKSVLNITFSQLHHGEQKIPVEAKVQSFTNSKGQQDVDEEGRMIEKKSNVGKAAAGTGVGALIGGIAGGAKGAAIGAGIGGAASLVLIQVAAKGANITFAPGSEIVLSVREARRSGE